MRYGFLLRGVPAGDDTTHYAAWFHDPEIAEWTLIARFARPETDTHLTGLYSFLENYQPHTGNRSREARFGNPWVRDTTGTWHPVTEAHVTADATATKRARLDFDAGMDGNDFTLKNCGFFSAEPVRGRRLTRTPSSPPPAIDLDALP